MDLTLVDVTGLVDVSVGDEVILLGSLDGLSVDAREHAALAGTVLFLILCGRSKRGPRPYSNHPCPRLSPPAELPRDPFDADWLPFPPVLEKNPTSGAK